MTPQTPYFTYISHQLNVSFLDHDKIVSMVAYNHHTVVNVWGKNGDYIRFEMDTDIAIGERPYVCDSLLRAVRMANGSGDALKNSGIVQLFMKEYDLFSAEYIKPSTDTENSVGRYIFQMS